MSPDTVRYGRDRAQVAEVWRPPGAGTEAVPVVVLVHGGFWRPQYGKRLMHRLARAVTDQGWMAYNIEYRRVGPSGRGGWPRTFQDVSDAIDFLAQVDGADLTQVATCGHSAGGHLALWAASARAVEEGPAPHVAVDVRAAVSLAGVVDLDAAARAGVGRGAVDALMGAGPDEEPERYRLASPAALLPLGKPQLLLHGLTDDSVPPSLSEHYTARAVGLGDPAVYVPLPGVGHMEVISGRGTAFTEVASWLRGMFGAPAAGG